jgi:hypothetical protein
MQDDDLAANDATKERSTNAFCALSSNLEQTISKRARVRHA